MASTSTSNSSTEPQQKKLKLSPDSRFIAEGDLVLLWLSRDKDPIPTTVTPGQEATNAFGAFPHNDMIGKPWGSRLYAKSKRGYICLLKPTPSLWTLSLPHRTQILYYPDICFITLKLNIVPGSKLIEAGTGSGSFTHWSADLVGRVGQWGAGAGTANQASSSTGDSDLEMTNREEGSESPSGGGIEKGSANGKANGLVREQGWHGRHATLSKRFNWKGLENNKIGSTIMNGTVRGQKLTPAQKEALKNSRSLEKLDATSSTSTPEPASSTSNPALKDGELDQETKEKEEKADEIEREIRGREPIQREEVGDLNGKIWSFEFHKGRKEKAEAEFASHGLSPSLVTLSHRDVCKSGFGLPPLADALFLDVPSPWEAIPHALNALRPEVTTRICCFSPCMEQVLRTVEALRKHGFDGVETFEVLGKNYESATFFEESLPEFERMDKGKGKEKEGDEDESESGQKDGKVNGNGKGKEKEKEGNGYPNPNQEGSDISNAILKIREVEIKKKNRRKHQIENARLERERKAKEKAERKKNEGKRKREELEGQKLNGDKVKVENENEEAEAKKLDEMEVDEVMEEQGEEEEEEEVVLSADPDFPVQKPIVASGRRDVNKTLLQPANVWAKVLPEMRGHTSYLTFAVLLPRAI